MRDLRRRAALRGARPARPPPKILTHLRLPAPHGGERQCRRFLLAGGWVLRERFPGEAVPEPCDFGCAAGACFAERDFTDPDAEALVRVWALCGGRARHGWPRAGALTDQDAAQVLWFEAIDGLLAREEARIARMAQRER